jgi:predicted dehydrogenase
VLGSESGYLTYGLDPQEEALRAGRRPGDDQGPWGTVEPEQWGLLGAEPDIEPVPTLPGDYPAFYAAMAAAILDGKPVPVDPREAVMTLRLLDAARRSAATGAGVDRRITEPRALHRVITPASTSAEHAPTANIASGG